MTGSTKVGSEELRRGAVGAPSRSSGAHGRSWCAIGVALSAALPLLLAGPVAAQCGSSWFPSDGLPGADSRINAATVWDPDGAGPARPHLVLAGNFGVAGTKTSRLLAAWDGTEWTRMDVGFGASAYSLTVHNDQVIAGFDSGVLAWNGAKWIELGNLGATWTLASYASTLIAGGSDGYKLAEWTGSAWTPFGDANGSVYASAVVGSDLYVAGALTKIGGVDVGHVARFDGTSWHALGSGVNGWVYALTEFNGDIVVAGSFQDAGGTPTPFIARWDGDEWHAMGSQFNDIVTTLEVVDGTLLAGGRFFKDEAGDGLNHIAWWDGVEWRNVGDGTGDALSNAATVFDIVQFNGDLIAVGNLESAGAEPVSNMARWVGPITDGVPNERSGFGWKRVGRGFDGPIEAFAEVNGELVAAGSFDTAGSTAARGLAAWDGQGREGWRRIEPELGCADGSEPIISAVVAYEEGMVVAGRFDRAGQLPVDNIARWDGKAWHAMGGGLTGAANAAVNALAVFEGQLYAGGSFTVADGAPAARVARWNGAAWQALGAGVSHTVRSFGEFGGELMVGGDFTSAGGAIANRIAAWNGTSWHSMGTGFNQSVHAIAVHEGALIAGGYFTLAGGAPVQRVAKWNGSSWEAMGNVLNDGVRSLLSTGGHLYAGGEFDASPGTYSHMARWNGESWVTMGSGVDFAFSAAYVSRVNVLAAFRGGIVVGGNFTRVGTGGGFENQWASPYFAQWGDLGIELEGDIDCSSNVNGPDLLILLGSWGPCIDCEECAADLNGDCTVNGADLVTVLGNWTGP